MNNEGAKGDVRRICNWMNIEDLGGGRREEGGGGGRREEGGGWRVKGKVAEKWPQPKIFLLNLHKQHQHH
jgi:hypothetical protein